MRVGRGVRQALVAHIYGVFALLGDVGVPCGDRRSAVLADGRGLPVGAVFERIFRVAEVAQVIDETFPLAGCPFLLAVVLAVGGLRIDLAAGIDIVVHDHLMGVGVALARQEHVGSGVLEHRHHVGQDVAHGIGVLDGLEQQRTLPLPCTVLEVTAMAVPHGHDIVVHALGDLRHRIHLLDERRIAAVLLRKLVDPGDIVGQRFAVYTQTHFVVRQGVGQGLAHVALQGVDQPAGHRQIGEVLVERHGCGV